MYKVMLVDDEGIVIDSLTFIIEKNFGSLCQIKAAKTGRAAIELAESFRPDVVFMDIHMPGLNGIEAMREIKSRNQGIVFVVFSAYDKFNYAKQAIDLGVLDYLMKPVNNNKILEVLRKAMAEIDLKRKKISDDLAIKEKLKTVVPILEHGFIYTVLFQEYSREEMTGYENLLGLHTPYGFLFVIEYGDDASEGKLTNPVGASVKVQKIYDELRETVKEFGDCIVGAPMANRIAVFEPWDEVAMDYNGRIRLIENMRVLTRMLKKQFGLSTRIGIGSVRPFAELSRSYKEAIEALQAEQGCVTHIDDLPSGCRYDEDYPIELEEHLFEAVQKGNVNTAHERSGEFYNWMMGTYQGDESVVRLKVLEFILWAERLAYIHGGMTYHFHSRGEYMEVVMKTTDLSELGRWFQDKMTAASRNVSAKQDKQANTLVEQAKEHIHENFSSELSLDEVSREINISPYYFSKLFKEQTGVNFVEYVTEVRIGYAKERLKDSMCSIKEICIDSGYSDPNYFSRIFKKCTGVTPSEYREGGVGV